jgi:glycyl-tRNA synthetase beta chain
VTTRHLFFELGTEELPAGEIVSMAEALQSGIVSGLTEQKLPFSEATTFCTPRRLAVWVKDVATKAPDEERDVVGPPLSAARDEQGGWTKAAEGFARKQGIDVDALTVREEQGVERVTAHIAQDGANATDVIPTIVAGAVASIPVSKRMRWGRSREEFLRPVQWLVLLFGEDVLPLELFGMRAGRETRGHRFHSSTPISLTCPTQYEDALREARVIVDVAERKKLVAEQVTALAASNETVALSEDLLNEVTGLVEWPVALRGSFDPAFLAVPAQALISAMKTHQKYFHINDTASGELLPSFITVANIISSDAAKVIAGNERVIRPRLADAAFFFANDKTIRLASRMERLAGVVFQNKLGSVLDKTHRIESLAETLAQMIGADTATTTRAASLAKCDLVSEMVLEFPELQGVAGADYALHDGEPEAIALAIREHYCPRYAGDDLPTSEEATAVALADRIDTLIGIFGIGEPPTGSKDPFALRRASLAVIRMLVSLDKPVPLREVLQHAHSLHAAALSPTSVDEVLNYIFERLDSWYGDQSIPVDVVRAVLAVGGSDLFDINLRIEALSAFSETKTAKHLAAANKRVANILAKAEEGENTPPDQSLFTEQAERALFDRVSSVGSALEPLLEARDYRAALNELASLRVPVDDFFEAVMVNAEDPRVRRNRLQILGTLRSLFTQLADMAMLSPGAE